MTDWLMIAVGVVLTVGTALFADPYAPIKIAQGLSRYMEENGIQSLSELTGGVKPW